MPLAEVIYCLLPLLAGTQAERLHEEELLCSRLEMNWVKTNVEEMGLTPVMGCLSFNL